MLLTASGSRRSGSTINVTCYGYSILVERGGRFQPEKAQALQIPKPYWSRLQKGETIETPDMVYTPDMVLGPPRKGIKLTLLHGYQTPRRES